MATYLIGYDLNRPGQDYESLLEAIKGLGNWWHHLDSTWVVKSSRSAAGIRDSLTPYLDENDEILVVALTGEGAWRGFAKKGSEWLKANL